MPTRRAILRAARWAGVALGVLAVAVAGVLLGMRLAGSQTYQVALGEVRLEVEPKLSGEVDAYIPIADWGIRADAFTAPLRLRGEVRSVNRRAVLSAAGGDADVIDRARRELDDAAASVLLREALFALAGTAAAALLAALALHAWRRPRRRTLVALAAAVLLTGAAIVATSLLLARSTFDPDAFDRPRFYARGAELLQLLDAAAQSDERAARYRSKIEGTLVRLSDLLASSGVGDPPGALAASGRRVLLASDLHANTLVLEPLEELAEPGSPVFFVGDFGHQGGEAEARAVAPRLGRLGSRVIAVSGNHDSTDLMQRLARSGVTVLGTDGRLDSNGEPTGDDVIQVRGLKVAGWSDPLEWRGDDPDDPERIFGFSELPDGDEKRAEAEKELVDWYDALPERPDVVLVHQNGLAQHLAATIAKRPDHRPFVVFTGHDHLQHVDRHGDVVVIDAGSAGAGGVLGIGDERVAVGDVSFAATGASVRFADLIEVDPFSGAAQAERVIVEGNECEDDEESCELSR
jgi:predicted phosphodiesterase